MAQRLANTLQLSESVVESVTWVSSLGWFLQLFVATFVVVLICVTGCNFRATYNVPKKVRNINLIKVSSIQSIRDLVLTFCPIMHSIQQRKLKLLMHLSELQL